MHRQHVPWRNRARSGDDRGPARQSARSAQERDQNNMDGYRENWVRHSDALEERKRLSEALKGWWKLARPFKAWGLYRKLRATTEASRRARNERLLGKRLADPALANLNEDQRRAVIVQEDRTLIVAGAGTGKTHTMVAKARDSVRTGIARPEEIAFITFTRKAAQEIRDRSGDLPGMEIGTIHHLARVVIMRIEGRKPRLTPLVEDETRRLTQIEAWLLEAVQEDPSLLADLETRRQAIARCRTPQGEIPPGVRVPPDKVLVRSNGEAQIATTLHLAEIPYRYEAEFPGEVFIERIEPGEDGRKIAIPGGYQENGTWVRGTFDQHTVHEGGPEGAGVGLVCEGAWFERRLALVDATRQVDELHARALAMRETMGFWKRADETTGFRHVQWVLLEPYKGPCSAPPLHLRIRCWREVVIEPVGRAPVRMLEEGLWGDDERTAKGAVARWRTQAPSRAGVPVTVRSVSLAKKQPAPMPMA